MQIPAKRKNMAVRSHTQWIEKTFAIQQDSEYNKRWEESQTRLKWKLITFFSLLKKMHILWYLVFQYFKVDPVFQLLTEFCFTSPQRHQSALISYVASIDSITKKTTECFKKIKSYIFFNCCLPRGRVTWHTKIWLRLLFILLRAYLGCSST